MSGTLTIRQRVELERWVRELSANYGIELKRSDLAICYRPETRPQRGHDIDVHWVDDGHFLTGTLDPYGSGNYAVGDVTFTHNGFDEECACSPCTGYRVYDQ